ncbi:SIR2 family NAD-dependent protein deacylase [Halarcobacter anaerophilus]|jgi:NAD-dependent deacetylase|uniref:protein acetyllysine N-acetyltransferase n=2 Tax=Halarcobacter anaerophilus TaxID=877500 RepID=A0A4Q0Y4S9_9BACT|nr:Sir2 family NAD-dependent protein deacetylase [Halarcobacter anaerophilus]QDF29359.1 NAD-dependent protein deacetylase, SIR2 family [Halarcobacter anaerophilus]RXJ64605.1 NAD-dependent deacetylase [Halarcobacter anaerophilus]
MDKKVVILSGAGLSASSGISTFRDKGGLWENHDINEICMAGCLNWNYEATVNFYNQRREDIKNKKPNNAHKMIARLKNKYPRKIEVITQNIDDLLEKAKCQDIIHLHGFLQELRCMSCDDIVNIKYEMQNSSNSTCKKCGAKMRPNIVFFGEAAPMYEKLYKILEDCGLLVVIGTSGNVIDVSSLANFAQKAILNNLEPSSAIVEECFDKIYYEDANTAYKKIEKDIEEYINN